MNSRSQCLGGLLALLTVAFVAPRISAQSSPPEQQEHFQRSFTVNPAGTLSVDNYKGSIKVTAANSNQVVINVFKHFDGSEADRKWWMENTEVKFNNSGNRVEVEVKYPNRVCVFCWDENYSGWVDLEIQTPRQMNLEVKSYKPEITISALEGDIRINSYKSPIRIEGTKGAVHIDTYKDVIKLERVAIRGTLEVKSYKAETDISASSLGQSADIESEKGTIRIRVPKNTGMDVDYSGGRRSSFHSDFPLSTNAGNTNSEVRGTINNGGTHVRLRTERGSVSIEQIAGEI